MIQKNELWRRIKPIKKLQVLFSFCLFVYICLCVSAYCIFWIYSMIHDTRWCFNLLTIFLSDYFPMRLRLRLFGLCFLCVNERREALLHTLCSNPLSLSLSLSPSCLSHTRFLSLSVSIKTSTFPYSRINDLLIITRIPFFCSLLLFPEKKGGREKKKKKKQRGGCMRSYS